MCFKMTSTKTFLSAGAPASIMSWRSFAGRCRPLIERDAKDLTRFVRSSQRFSAFSRERCSRTRGSGQHGSVRSGGRFPKGLSPGLRHRDRIASVSVRPEPRPTTAAASAPPPFDKALVFKDFQCRPNDMAPDLQTIHDILLDQPLPRLQPTEDDVFLQSRGEPLAFAHCLHESTLFSAFKGKTLPAVNYQFNY